MFEFTIHASDPHSAARVGTFHTPHGDIQTPVFMPCGTKGAVKTLTPDELTAIGCDIILGNTYHLMLRPGEELVAEMGGLHKWTGWNKPILTDSGGFQIFSLQNLRTMSDEGATFTSHIDGSLHTITPERAVQIQESLGADIIMAFDECPPGDADYATVKKAVEQTHRWAERCFKAKTRTDQSLFPIIQGGIFEDLRKMSAEYLLNLPAHGIAVGGVAVGEPKPYMWKVLEIVAPLLPSAKPHYLMGIGDPADIVRSVAYGIDMFDCVLPTRLARHGTFFTNDGRKNIENAKFRLDKLPLDEECTCYTCERFNRSYIRHLFTEGEMLAHRLLTLHNLTYLVDLTKKIRRHITEGSYKTFHDSYLSRYEEKKSIS